MDLDEIIGQPVDIAQLIKKIDFTEEEVESAAIDHSKLFKRAARFRVQKMRDQLEATSAYETAVAKLSARYQDRKDEKGKRTLTESAVKSRVQLDKKIQKLRKRMERAFVHEKFSELLLKNMDKREFAIKVVIDARWSELGKVFKGLKEEGAKKMSRKMMKEVRDRYEKLGSSNVSD